MRHYYLSFTDPTLPEGSQFLGACILRASSLREAVRLSHLEGCNPGGEGRAVDVGGEVPERWRDRLLSKGSLVEMNRQLGWSTRRAAGLDARSRRVFLFALKFDLATAEEIAGPLEGDVAGDIADSLRNHLAVVGRDLYLATLDEWLAPYVDDAAEAM